MVRDIGFEPMTPSVLVGGVTKNTALGRQTILKPMPVEHSNH